MSNHNDDEACEVKSTISSLFSNVDANLDSKNEVNLSELTDWMVNKADILPSNAFKYATVIIKNEIGSFNRIAKRLTRNPQFFIDIGISLDDAEEIARAMKAEGLIVDIPKQLILPSETGRLTTANVTALESSLVDITIMSSPFKRKKKKRSQEEIDRAEKDKIEVAALVEALSGAFEKESEEETMFFLTAIVKDTTGSRRKQKYFGRNNACQLIMKIIRKFSKSIEVCEACLEVISLFCRHSEDKKTENIENIQAFGDSGVNLKIFLRIKSVSDFL